MTKTLDRLEGPTENNEKPSIVTDTVLQGGVGLNQCLIIPEIDMQNVSIFHEQDGCEVTREL